MKKVTQTLSRPPFGLDKILVAVISKIKYILVSIKPQKINSHCIGKSFVLQIESIMVELSRLFLSSYLWEF